MIRNNFKKYISLREGKEIFEQPHVISADPPMKLPHEIMRLADAFKKAKEVSLGKEVDPKGGEKDITLKSKKIFVVGDAVAAYLLSRTPRSFDLMTDAHPEEVVRICRASATPINVTKVDKNSGIVKVNIDGKPFSIETLKDGLSSDEEIPFTNDLGKDSKRRDLTIDSLYYDISGNKIIDYNGGLRHLQNGDVKFIGKADEKINQDGMRKFKYAYMINKIPNGKVDPDMSELFKTLKSQELPKEKVREMFWSGLEDIHVNAKKYIKTYADLDLLDVVFPGLDLNLDFPECKTCKTRPIVLASLLKDNTPSKLVKKLQKLHYTDREIKDAVFLINLLKYNEEYQDEFKQYLLHTSLTRRQMIDWAKLNHISEESIEKLLDYQPG